MDFGKNAALVFDTLRRGGCEAYYVGGCLRDAVIGRAVKDIDIAASAAPRELKEIFSGFTVLETGFRHGTLTVIAGGENIEVTSLRTDGEYADFRRPENVAFGASVGQDLSRRDFTVNAMAFSPERGIIDPFGGIADIKNKKLRAVGAPDKRFREDALRIMRALRFASVLGFGIEEKTALSMSENKNLLKKISAERIYKELQQLLCGINADETVKKYFDIIKTVMPRAEAPVFDINGLDEIFEHRFSAFYSDPEMAGADLCALKPEKAAVKRVLYLTAQLGVPDGETELKLFLSRDGLRKTVDIAAFREKAYSEKRLGAINGILKNGEAYSLKQLAVNGNDIISAGVKPSETGKTLEKLLIKVIKKELPNEKDALLKAVKIEKE